MIFSTEEARNAGLVTSTPDDIDWDDEVRIAIESARASRPTRSPAWKRACASPDRRPMLTRVFGRLTAWQNWIFNRPNAVGEQGAQGLRNGAKAKFNWERV